MHENYNYIGNWDKVKKVLVDNGIEIRTTKQTSRKYTHTYDFFEKIDNEEKAYWLGFLYADGYITRGNKTGVKLGIKDLEHLEKFRNSLKITNPIEIGKVNSFGTVVEYCRVILTSEKTFNDLSDKGCVKNKSLILNFPTEEILPKELVNHFIRGYFDGDGSIYTSKGRNFPSISFTGTKEFLEGIVNNSNLPKHYLEKNIFKEKRREGNIYNLKLWKREDTKQFIDFMYSNSTIYLDRKYERAKTMIEDIQRL